MNASEPILRRYEQGYNVKLGKPAGLLRFASSITDYQMNLLRIHFDDSFSEWSSIIDGSPFFAEAEAVMIRVVTKQWKIVNVVIRIAMLKKSPDHKTLADSYRSAIKRMRLDPLKQRAIMSDRAAVNGAMVRRLSEEHGMGGLHSKCHSHTVVLVGTKFSAKSCKTICAHITRMFAHAGHARLCFHGEFGVAPKSGGGNRWWVSWEQLLNNNILLLHTCLVLSLGWCILTKSRLLNISLDMLPTFI